MKAMRRRFCKMGVAGACALLVGQLFLPSAALAAEWIYIAGGQYDVASSGEGWAWDGADNLDLNGYNGTGIYAQGDLNVNLAAGSNNSVSEDASAMPVEPEVSDNEVFRGALSARDGDLTIQGEGALTVNGTSSVINTVATSDADGHWETGDISIKGPSVKVNASTEDWTSSSDEGLASGIVAGDMTGATGTVSISDGAEVSIIAGAERDGSWSVGSAMGIIGGNISIVGDETKVDIEAAGRGEAAGIYARSAEVSIVSIKGGAFVTAHARMSESELGIVSGISAHVWSGNAAHVIVDGGPTSLRAIAEGGTAGSWSYGIYAAAVEGPAEIGISILGGTVYARGGKAAMYAVNTTTADGLGGTITLGPGARVLPAGTVVRDYWSTAAFERTMSAGSIQWGEKGQTFGRAGEGVLDETSADLATSVTVDYAAAPVTPPAADGESKAEEVLAAAKDSSAASPKVVANTAGLLAKTGDEVLVTAAALAIAGIAGLLTAAFVTRRRD